MCMRLEVVRDSVGPVQAEAGATGLEPSEV